MSSFLSKGVRYLVSKLFKKKQLEESIVRFSHFFHIDLLNVAYQNMGILKYWSDEISGEKFVVENILPRYISSKQPVFLDVGANVGNYSKLLSKVFPHSKIFALELNPHTFDILFRDPEITESNISCVNLGFSSKETIQKFYTYAQKDNNMHASLYKDVFTDLHHDDQLLEIESSTIPLDIFCEKHDIAHVSFLKIDTEGHEFEVLKGAQKMLSLGKLDIIQFEFNEMNIISRVFLRDFYHFLKEYRFYRVDSDRLIPIFEYSSENEIFRFQNILAISKKFDILH